MGAEFTDPRVIGAHFSGMVARHRYKFTAGQNVEFIGMQHQPAGNKIGCRQPFPEIADLTACRRVNIDKAGMFACAPPDNVVRARRGQIDAERHTVADINIGCAADKPDIALQLDHRVVRHRRRTTPQPQL